MEWKARIEQQLTEISDSLTAVQVPNQCATFSPSAPGEWENWFGSNELGNIPVDFPNWLENCDLVDMAPQDDQVQYPFQAAPTKEKPSNVVVKIESETIEPDPPCQVMVNIEQEATVQGLYQAPPVVKKPHDYPAGQDLCQAAPSTGKRPSNNPSVDRSYTRELELLREELAEVRR